MKKLTVEFSEEEVFVGVDVSKETLTVFVSLDGSCFDVENNRKGHLKLEKLCRKLGQKLKRVCMEATGGYQTKVAQHLLESGLPVSVINPQRGRDYMKAQGVKYKNDPIDAQGLACFAKQTNPMITKLQSKEIQELKALAKRREQHLNILKGEKCRLQQTHDEMMLKDIRDHIHYLKSCLKKIEKRIDDLFTASTELRKKRELLKTINGVGAVSSFALVTCVPELGRESNKRVSALVGVAPFTQRSGKWKGKEKISGGRAYVREKLYMAAFNAVNRDPYFAKYHEQLMSRGKPYKVALVAVMRKLLCICNSMIKNNEPWDPQLVAGPNN